MRDGPGKLRDAQSWARGELEHVRRTGDRELMKKANQIFDWAIAAGRDQEYGGWYGHLRRDGLPAMPPAKGSTFKGPSTCPGA